MFWTNWTETLKQTTIGGCPQDGFVLTSRDVNTANALGGDGFARETPVGQKLWGSQRRRLQRISELRSPVGARATQRI
jgi:hypothetical protein